jgi:hypothetical protein
MGSYQSANSLATSSPRLVTPTLAKIALTWSRTVWLERKQLAGDVGGAGPAGDQAGDLLLAVGQVVGLDDDRGDRGRRGRLDDHGDGPQPAVGVVQARGMAYQPGPAAGPGPGPGGPVAVPGGGGEGAEDRAQQPHRHPDAEVAGEVLVVGELGQPRPGLLVGRAQPAVAVEQQQPGPAVRNGPAEEVARAGPDPDRLPERR